jgi:hypothetical protein
MANSLRLTTKQGTSRNDCVDPLRVKKDVTGNDHDLLNDIIAAFFTEVLNETTQSKYNRSSGREMNKVEVKITLRLTVGQSVSLGVEPHLGLTTRYLLLFDSYGLVFCGAPSLTR